jgi:hypothetical protein
VGHAHGVISLSWLEGANLLLSGSWDGTAKACGFIYILYYIIYIYTYKCTYIHKKGSMYHTHAHPDGFWQAWDVAGGECVLTLEGHENGKRSTSKKHTHTHTHTYIYIHTQRKRELQTGVSVLGLPTGDVATASTGREEVGCGFPSFFLPCVVD